MLTIQEISVQEINRSILDCTFTNDQLDSIICAVKFARGQLIVKNKCTMNRGTKVKFTCTRTGQTIVGEITAIKRKFIHVLAGASIWRVSANMLSEA